MLSKRMELVAPADETSAPVVALNSQTIRCCVENALRNYFSHLDGHPASDIYQMVLAEVEAPLLEVVLEYTRNNQHAVSAEKRAIREACASFFIHVL
jgi:DNA-binding protein Fis